MTMLTALAPAANLIGTDSLALLARSEATADMPDFPLIASHSVSYRDSQFRISLFAGPELTRGASSLLNLAYGRLGYACNHASKGIDADATLQATVDNRVVGTLSVTLDSHRGIQAQTLYANEMAYYRQRGKICEFTRLATDPDVAGREVLCSLFYVAYVYAHLVRSATDLFIEVNPRHVSFYKRMLGFQQRGDVRPCPRVKAPAVLLHLDFRYTAMQIARARNGLSVDASRLYQHASTAEQEQHLAQDIRSARFMQP